MRRVSGVSSATSNGREAWFCGFCAQCILLRGSVAPKACVVALPSAIFCVVLKSLMEASPDIEDAFGGGTLNASQLWAALTASCAFCISFRTNKAYSRFWEGTTLLHQMRGEWYDSVSCLVAFSHLSLRTRAAEVQNFRHSMVRLMSLCHGSALEEIQTDDQDGGFSYLDIGGLDQKTLRYLRDCKTTLYFNRVEVLIHMMQTLIVHHQDNGLLKIPPPILSRVFQTLSRGQVNLMNCKKIRETSFPFSFVQLIAVLCTALALFTPVVMSNVLEDRFWGFIFTFIPVYSLVALNYAAVELEMPFGEDSTDLPLARFQAEMNSSMLMLIRRETDQIPHISNMCSLDFESMCERLSTNRVRDFITDDTDEEIIFYVATDREDNSEQTWQEPKAQVQQTPSANLQDPEQMSSFAPGNKAGSRTDGSKPVLPPQQPPPPAALELNSTALELAFQDLARGPSEKWRPPHV
mmetsp:Transcript_26940/g.48693  ORF Transcript_26940/g.48693 Transcript_26940/m.48693 type:complete len:465 (-) Transcript_26940:87-1481(-)